MANWAFEIDLADNYIIDLTNTLTDKGFRIWCLNNHDEMQPIYLFSSEYLNHVPDDKVYVQARQLVRFIDGLSYLLFENKNNVNKITFSAVIDNSTMTFANVQRSDNIPAIPDIDFTVYTTAIEEDENPLAHLLKLVPTDKFVEDILLTVAPGMDFRSMYQAYDLIKTFLTQKGNSLPAIGYPNDMLEPFIRTAIMGTNARHGKLRQDPEGTDMRLDKAQELISGIILEVLTIYYKINLTPYIIKDKPAGWNNFYDSMYD